MMVSSIGRGLRYMHKQGFYASKNSYRLGNEHDSRRLLELVEGLDWRPEQLYADASYDTEPIRLRIYRYRA
jgi:hypothetical protein